MLKLVAAGGMLLLLALYVGTYLSLRNRGIAEMKQYDSPGFLYDSADRVNDTHDLGIHYFHAVVFAPLNWLDQALFNGPGPIRCIMFELS